ncbi:Polcalcin Aln g like [Paragonimus heterotremus]|uniref:Polcalcin Aln g like n=1 Tax=Paragonimus heterotremus TaxID=100268 RepID=A0A8J4SXY4_9TREM|nr:Polcalcin Aln g like [Paragonimus heterotremus]
MNESIDTALTVSSTFTMPNLKKANEVLKAFDHNGDGKISASELQKYLESENCAVDRVKAKNFIKSHDTNHDGKLDLHELANFLDKQ